MSSSISKAPSRRNGEQLGPEHRGYVCNVVNLDQCHKVATQVIADLGQVDILVNNAGISQPLKLMEIKPADYDAVMDVNLRGVLYLSQAFIPHYAGAQAGSIVCMSSVSAQRGGGIFGGPHYSAAKAGVLGLAKAMAREFGPDGIRVNCVTPGLIQTDITGGKLDRGDEGGNPRGHPAQPPWRGRRRRRTPSCSSPPTFRLRHRAAIDVNGGMLIH